MRQSQIEKLKAVKAQLHKSRNELDDLSAEIWQDAEIKDEGTPQSLDDASTNVLEAAKILIKILEEK